MELRLSCIAFAWTTMACAPGGNGVEAVPEASAEPPSNAASTTSPLPASAAPSASAAPVSEEEERENAGCKFRKSTNVMSRCTKLEPAPGGWSPSRQELMQAASLASGSCYCASGLAKAIEDCGQKQDSGLVSLTLGTLDDATDCSLIVTAAKLGERRFLRLHAHNRDQATFYSIITVAELKANAGELYYQGFNVFDPPGSTKDADPNQHSVALRRDWPTLPRPFQEWLAKAPDLP